MDQPFGDEPELSGDIFRDVPLFREIQRVLFASTGPVNWELARQVGIATAVGGRPDPEPTEEDGRLLEQTVRAAELAVADATGMEAPAEVARTQPIRRARWVEANITGLRGFFEPGAERLAKAMSEAQQHELAEERVPGLEGLTGLGQMMGRMAPLLMGAQIGMVLGALGGRVLGQYEVPLPRRDQPALLFVIPNIAEFEREWDLPPEEFRAWVALHEVTHAFQLGRRWVRDYFLRQVRELADSMEFDVTGLEERLTGFDLSDPDRMTEAFSDFDQLLGQSVTEDQRLLMRRLQALMSAAEGHADHVMSTVGRRMLRSWAQIDEALRRRHEERSEHERMMERLLGLELKREQYALGRAFCEQVVSATDDRTLARMWDGPDALPSMPELEEPRLWLARMA
jgi:putative hydrolase